MWPLHIKQLSTSFSWSSAEALVAGDPEQLLAFNYFKDAVLHPQVERHSQEALRVSDLPDDDVSLLLATGRIEPVPPGDLVAEVIPFSVPEVPKRRRRFIAFSKVHNSTPTIRISLPSAASIREGVRLTPGARLDDLKTFYQQLPLPQESRNFYAFRTSRGVFRLTTVPTGHSHCPGMAQILSTSLTTPGSTDVYIDNFRSCGTPESTQASMTTIHSRAADVGLEFNRENTGFQTRYTFLGVVCDHDKKTVELSSKALAKLHQIRQRISREFSHLSLDDAVSFLSYLIYASSILQVRLGPFYYIFKCIRRRIRSETKRARLWPSTQCLWLQWIDILIANHPSSVLPPTDAAIEATLYTDASLSGWGAVLFINNSVHVLADSWSPHLAPSRHINELEAWAIRNALQGFEHFLANSSITLFVDNTTCVTALQRGLSRNFIVNTVAGWADQFCHRLSARINVSYIASSENLADAPSRIFSSSSPSNLASASWFGQGS